MADPKPVAKMKPRELAEELIELRLKHAAVFDRDAELKSALKEGATANFKEIFVGKGEVGVSAAKVRELTGTAPELVASNFLALPRKEQKALTKAGTVQIVDVYKEAYHGAVRVKLF